MSRTLKLLGGPLDGDYRDIWPELLPGYTPARHNGQAWVARWMYTRGGRRGWCLMRCKTRRLPQQPQARTTTTRRGCGMTEQIPPRVLAAEERRRFRQLLARSSLGCPTGDCDHLISEHYAWDYTSDGTPIRPVCRVAGCLCPRPEDA